MSSFPAHSFAVYTSPLESSSACHGGYRGCLRQVACENPIQVASLVANGDAMPYCTTAAAYYFIDIRTTFVEDFN